MAVSGRTRFLRLGGRAFDGVVATVTRGFRHDPIKEHAWLTEIAVEHEAWRNAEGRTAEAVRRAIADGARAAIVAEHLGLSRATLYRWLATHKPKQPQRSGKSQSRNRAG